MGLRRAADRAALDGERDRSETDQVAVAKLSGGVEPLSVEERAVATLQIFYQGDAVVDRHTRVAP